MVFTTKRCSCEVKQTHYKLYYYSIFCQVIFTYYTQFPKILSDFVYRSGGTFASPQKHIYAKSEVFVRFFGLI